MNRFIMGLILIIVLAIAFFYVWRKSSILQIKNLLPQYTSPSPSGKSGSNLNSTNISSPMPIPSASPLLLQNGILPATGL